MKTVVAKQKTAKERTWYVIDAKSKNLGRLATKIAELLKGKNLADFTPHIDNGAYVVVTNCGKFEVTGDKMTDKLYRHHSRWLGGTKEATLKELLKKDATKPLEQAVFGMLPKNKHRSNMLGRLRLETSETHGYEAQQPKTIQL